MKLHFEIDPDIGGDIKRASSLLILLGSRLFASGSEEKAREFVERERADAQAKQEAYNAILADEVAPPPPVSATNEMGFNLSNAPTPPNLELDSAGLPWDGRIHSETRSKTQNGEWRGRRNVTAAMRALIEAELRGQSAVVPMATVGTTAEVPPPPPATVPIEVPPPPVTAPIEVAPPREPAPIQGSPVPSVGSPTVVVNTFPELVVYISSRFRAGTLTPAQTKQVANMYGFDTIPGFMSKPELIPQVVALLETM